MHEDTHDRGVSPRTVASAATGDLPQGSIGYKTIFAVGALLFVITFTLNYLSNRVVRRFREAYE